MNGKFKLLDIKNIFHQKMKHGFHVVETPKTYDFRKDKVVYVQKIIKVSPKSFCILLKN